MVRKRSRNGSTKKKNSRKLNDSDDNESDYKKDDSDSSSSPPPPKRYGLRQRKQPVFFTNFDDFDEDGEPNDTTDLSDDEEYDVQLDLQPPKVRNNYQKNNKKTQNDKTQYVEVSVDKSVPHQHEAENPDMLLQAGLIDFEDIIRADVVVNNKQNNAIKECDVNNRTVSPVETSHVETESPIFKEKAKRGRKPRAKTKSNNVSSLSSSSSTSSSTTTTCSKNVVEETNLEVPIDPRNFVQSNTNDTKSSKRNNSGRNGEKKSSKTVNNLNNKPEKPQSNGTSDFKLGPSTVDGIEKFVPPVLEEKEKEVILSNEYLLGNSFDMSAVEFLEKQAEKKDETIVEEIEVPQINFDDENSDDDVVIIEKKPIIIVLDDD